MGSINRCEMPAAGRADLHPPAHRVRSADSELPKVVAHAKTWGTAGKWAHTGSIPSQTIAAGPEMVKTLCLFFHFNYLFQFNYWLSWESEKVTPDLVVFRDFHTFSLYLFQFNNSGHLR